MGVSLSAFVGLKPRPAEQVSVHLENWPALQESNLRSASEGDYNDLYWYILFDKILP